MMLVARSKLTKPETYRLSREKSSSPKRSPKLGHRPVEIKVVFILNDKTPSLSDILVCEGVSFGRSILITVVSRGSSKMFVRENCVGLNNNFAIYFNLIWS